MILTYPHRPRKLFVLRGMARSIKLCFNPDMHGRWHTLCVCLMHACLVIYCTPLCSSHGRCLLMHTRLRCRAGDIDVSQLVACKFNLLNSIVFLVSLGATHKYAHRCCERYMYFLVTAQATKLLMNSDTVSNTHQRPKPAN